MCSSLTANDLTHLEDLREEGGGHLCSVLDNDVVTLVLVGDGQLIQELVCWLADLQAATNAPLKNKVDPPDMVWDIQKKEDDRCPHAWEPARLIRRDIV